MQFGRGYYEEHFYEIILNLDQWLRSCLKIFLIYSRGVEIVNFILAQGQVNSHNVLVQRKFYLSVRTDYHSLYLTVLKQYINSLENSMKPDINSLATSVDPDQLALALVNLKPILINKFICSSVRVNICLYYISINYTSFGLIVFWPSETESWINVLRFSDPYHYPLKQG